MKVVSNSSLVSYMKISPNKTSPRNNKIKKITPHHMAGNLSLETCGNIFANSSRRASSNYAIDSQGKVALYVEEKDRSWCSSNANNDHQAITIEVANDEIGGNWHVSDKALESLVNLCVDICKRNGIPELVYTGDSTGTLTRHNMFAATNCPGPYLQSKFPYIAQEVNKRLASKNVLYRVQTGAFSVKTNADVLEAKLKKAGFETYMVLSKGLYKVQVGAYSVKANADVMAKKLKAAGFDTYITTEVGSPVQTVKSKSISELAKEVIAGKWGNGIDRKNRLEKAGYDYVVVQKEVNKLL